MNALTALLTVLVTGPIGDDAVSQCDGATGIVAGESIGDLAGEAAALTVFCNGTDLENLRSEGQVRRLNLSPTRVGTGPATLPD